MGIIQNTSTRLPVHLSLAGVNVTGMLPVNVLNTSAQILKADGTKVLVALVNGVNWFEMDSVQSPGMYQFLLPGSAANILGPIQYTIYPAAAAFNSFSGATEVTTDISTTLAAVKAKTDNLPATPANEVTSTAIKAKTDLIPASPASEVTSAAIKAKTDLIGTAAVSSLADINAARDSIKGVQLIDISTIAGGASFVPGTDDLHSIKQAIGGLGASSWDDLLANHNLTGSFGAAIRLIQQAVAGDQKVQVGGARLQIYDIDGVTVLREFYLLDENNQPSINNVRYRKKV